MAWRRGRDAILHLPSGVAAGPKVGAAVKRCSWSRATAAGHAPQRANAPPYLTPCWHTMQAATVQSVDRYGCSPLHIAALAGHSNVVGAALSLQAATLYVGTMFDDTVLYEREVDSGNAVILSRHLCGVKHAAAVHCRSTALQEHCIAGALDSSFGSVAAYNAAVELH